LISTGAPSQTPLRELRIFPQTPWLYLRGPTSKGRKGVEGGGREGRGKGMEKEAEGICWTNVKLLPMCLTCIATVHISTIHIIHKI